MNTDIFLERLDKLVINIIKQDKEKKMKSESLKVNQAFLKEIKEKALECDMCLDQYRREEEANILNDYAELQQELFLIIRKYQDFLKD